MNRRTALSLFVTLLIAMTAEAQELLPSRKFLTWEAAKTIATAAEAEAAKNSWSVVIAIVDPGGHLMYLGRMTDAQVASVEIAQMKARTAALYKRPSKVFEDRIAAGGSGVGTLLLPGVFASEGGVPIVVDGQIIGAVGVSGVQSAQDAQIANAGIAALIRSK